MATAITPELSYTPANFRRSVILGVGVLAIIAGIFWVDSRYPALLKKLHKGSTVQVNGALTFDNVVAVDRTIPLPKRVALTTVNWLAANKIGMTFGFLFSAGALTLLPRFRSLGGASVYKNALWGTLGGIPLGVCSNCVAPIGQGLYASGMRKESVLATMISSPTLNVVVLAMVFSLFPLPIALLKVGLTLAILLVFVPWIASRDRGTNLSRRISPDSTSDSWGATFLSTLRGFAKNLWYLLRTAGPLMIAAALLGALAIELIPRDVLHTAVTPLGILAVAIVGTFLPVPMAFDVFAAFVAMRSGVPMPYVIVLLCTLGSYSVYSFLVTGRTMSWKTAASVFAVICLSGVVAGFAAGFVA